VTGGIDSHHHRWEPARGYAWLDDPCPYREVGSRRAS
jgi:predicted TIM-barrel fold metal-dependent hydrolase